MFRYLELMSYKNLLDEALKRFTELWEQARQSGHWEPDAMSLATATPTGEVSVRIVLLKEASTEGFVFYSNYSSRKAAALSENPRAALCFFWPDLKTQIRVEGVVERLSEAESDEYFSGRDRLSQLGAWASQQSQPLESPEALDFEVEEKERYFDARPIPRPNHWGGYRVRPRTIEFWSPGKGRLNRREIYRYENTDGSEHWTYGYLHP